MKAFLFIIILLNCALAFAQGKKVAVVKIIRGEVDVLTLGKTTRLKVDDWVEDGATVKTAEKSFAKLIFVDKSQMNVGPNSEMKIEKFEGNDSGVIDLVKGQIRSQVTKDYLQMKDKDKSKIFIKTPNAVMGIRGTDFLITTNVKNTAVFLFEGSVVLNRIDPRGVGSSAALENIVNQGVRMAPGEFSVVQENRQQPTIPARMNIQQRENLEKNETFDSRNPSSGNEEAKKTVVPDGLSGKVVSNDTSALKTEVAQVAGAPVAAANDSAAADASGFVKGDAIKPANGSFVHVETGVIIPPGSDSIFDPNSNTFIAGPDSGKVGSDGAYIPPKGMEITPDGKIMATVTDGKGGVVVIEQAAPAVNKTDAPKASSTGTAGATGPMASTRPTNVFNPGGELKPTPPPVIGTPLNRNEAAQQYPAATEQVRTIRTNN
jgi:hypothetical protein